MVSLQRHGAQIALENGSLEANVVHTGESAWSLSAGPFSVRVTGTKFSLSWDPDHERFSIRVTQGSVAVAGSVIGAERPLRAGETLVVSVPDQRLQLSNDQPAAASQQSATEIEAPAVASALPSAGRTPRCFAVRGTERAKRERERMAEAGARRQVAGGVRERRCRRFRPRLRGGKCRRFAAFG